MYSEFDSNKGNCKRVRYTTTHLLTIIFGGTTNYSPVIEQEQNNIGAPKMHNIF